MITLENTAIFRKIQEAVCSVFGCTVQELESKDRHSEIAFARYFIWHIARNMTTLKLIELGSFYRRDHATVLNGMKQIPGTLKYNYKGFAGKYDQVLKQLNFGNGIFIQNGIVMSINLTEKLKKVS
jgi:chromosomal replication initiation ATPase DnaA